MSDGITDAERKGRELSEEWKHREINSFLSMRTTKELVDELSKRENVTTVTTKSENSYQVTEFIQKKMIPHTHLYAVGAARILVVKE